MYNLILNQQKTTLTICKNIQINKESKKRMMDIILYRIYMMSQVSRGGMLGNKYVTGHLYAVGTATPRKLRSELSEISVNTSRYRDSEKRTQER